MKRNVRKELGVLIGIILILVVIILFAHNSLKPSHNILTNNSECNFGVFWSPGEYVSWDHAKQIVRSNQVYQLFHQDNLCITLFAQNDTSSFVFDTKEPYFNAFQNEIKYCGESCTNIEVYEILIMDWDKAVQSLKNQKIDWVSRFHSGNTGFYFDKRVIYTKEPYPDAYKEVIDKCGLLCKDTEIMVE